MPGECRLLDNVPLSAPGSTRESFWNLSDKVRHVVLDSQEAVQWSLYENVQL